MERTGTKDRGIDGIFASDLRQDDYRHFEYPILAPML